MKPLVDRLADRARRKAEAEAARNPIPTCEAYPPPHEAARAEAIAKTGHDPFEAAGIGRYDPDAVKVPN